MHFIMATTAQLCISSSRLQAANAEADAASMHERTVYRLASRLIQVARESVLDADALRTYLKALKAEYTP